VGTLRDDYEWLLGTEAEGVCDYSSGARNHKQEPNRESTVPPPPHLTFCLTFPLRWSPSLI